MEIFTLIKSEHWKRRNKYYQMCRIVWYNNYLAPKNNNWRFVLIQQLWYETHSEQCFFYTHAYQTYFPLLKKIVLIFTIKHLHLKTIILLADLWNLWYTNDNSCLVLTLFTAGSQISLWARADDAVIIRQTGTTVQAPFTTDS